MPFHDSLYRLRTGQKLSQAKLAERIGVTAQSVQKWESGAAVPELEKIIRISQYFGVSLDALLLDRDVRTQEEMPGNRRLRPQYANVPEYESYSAALETEYRQCLDEGLDVTGYADLFSAAAKMPAGEEKEKIADVLFDIVLNAARREGYAYEEPSGYAEIVRLRKAYDFPARRPGKAELKEKLLGAWTGRACGCLLGKPVEGARTDELVPFLKRTGNYPMHRYILNSDLTDEIVADYKFGFGGRCYADTVDGMPVDDDTNYTVLAQELIERRGRDFAPQDVAQLWLDSQPKSAYFTAERVAFCNFVKGYAPPASAMYKNPYREWIGAQIRGDYFGYINPGDPAAAAEMAFRDACISHRKNGIYGEMFASAMLACAAVTDSIEDIIRGGLAQIPATSRLYEAVNKVIAEHGAGVPAEECFARIHAAYDEHDLHGWCHTIPNAMIVAASLLYGEGDFGKSVCLAVQTGFDTDCNGATVGSVLGMRGGIKSIGAEWAAPLNGKLHTSIFGLGTVLLKARAEMTLRHIEQPR